MITLNKNKKDLTIDLKEITYNKFNTKKTKMIKDILKARRTNEIKQAIKFILCVAVFFFILIAGILIPKDKTNATEEVSIATKIRLARLESCAEAYSNSGIEYEFLYGQSLIVRCATYSTLIYAFESGYGQSEKCRLQKNCYGMKGNGVDKPAGFITFDTYAEGREWFAYKYFQWHFKKDIRTFVYNWSQTDREIYISYVKKHYWNIYNELEYLSKYNR